MRSAAKHRAVGGQTANREGVRPSGSAASFRARWESRAQRGRSAVRWSMHSSSRSSGTTSLTGPKEMPDAPISAGGSRLCIGALGGNWRARRNGLPGIRSGLASGGERTALSAAMCRSRARTRRTHRLGRRGGQGVGMALGWRSGAGWRTALAKPCQNSSSGGATPRNTRPVCSPVIRIGTLVSASTWSASSTSAAKPLSRSSRAETQSARSSSADG